MENKEYKRKNYLVKKEFQTRYVFYALIFFIIASLMVWWETYSTISYTFKMSGLYSVKMQDYLFLINKVVLLKLVIGAVLVAGIAFFLSHKIAGPASHLVRGMESIKDGELGVTVNFRKLDEFKEVSNCFNEMSASLRKKVEDSHASVKQIVEKNNSIIHDLKSAGNDVQSKRLEEINNQLAGLFNGFRV